MFLNTKLKVAVSLRVPIRSIGTCIGICINKIQTIHIPSLDPALLYVLGCDSLSLLCRELVDSELRLSVLGTEESSEGR